MPGMKYITTKTLLAVAVLFSGMMTGIAKGQTVNINCTGTGTPLQTAINAAAAGTTILVTGTCNESISIREEKKEITLDGQGTATINSPSASFNTVSISGRGTTLKRFTITGGDNGVFVFHGGEVLLDGNTIQGAGSAGVLINTESFGVIINNLIQNNAAQGIAIGDNSVARIGYVNNSDTVASPNSILNNGTLSGQEDGILITRGSHATIVGNIISGNKGDGIQVSRVSHADISANQISGLPTLTLFNY